MSDHRARRRFPDAAVMALERICREEGLGHDAATRPVALVRPDRSVPVNSKSRAGLALRGLPARAPRQVARRGKEAAQWPLPRHILVGDERHFPSLRFRGGNHQPGEPGSGRPGSPSSNISKVSTSTPSRASTRCSCWTSPAATASSAARTRLGRRQAAPIQEFGSSGGVRRLQRYPLL